MARDKLITIRIEGEKREAFNQLAKSHNTDTASLLYDFISGCLDGRIDISLVTGKKQWIDKIDNRIDSNRIDKLETTTQQIDNRIDTIAKKLTDSDQGLGEKITSLEHRLNALAIQLDSQRIDKIDMDSQKDSQQDSHPDSQLDRQRIDDMEPLLKLQREASIATSPIVEPTGEPSPDELDRPAIENVTPEVSPSPPDQPAIGTLPTVESEEKKIIPLPDILIASPIETVPKTHKDIAKRLGLKSQTKLNYWISTGRIPSEYADRCRFNESKTKILWI